MVHQTSEQFIKDVFQLIIMPVLNNHLLPWISDIVEEEIAKMGKEFSIRGKTTVHKFIKNLESINSLILA